MEGIIDLTKLSFEELMKLDIGDDVLSQEIRRASRIGHNRHNKNSEDAVSAFNSALEAPEGLLQSAM